MSCLNGNLLIPSTHPYVCPFLALSISRYDSEAEKLRSKIELRRDQYIDTYTQYQKYIDHSCQPSESDSYSNDYGTSVKSIQLQFGSNSSIHTGITKNC